MEIADNTLELQDNDPEYSMANITTNEMDAYQESITNMQVSTSSQQQNDFAARKTSRIKHIIKKFQTLCFYKKISKISVI